MQDVDLLRSVVAPLREPLFFRMNGVLILDACKNVPVSRKKHLLLYAGILC